jgi:hypothetical protein
VGARQAPFVKGQEGGQALRSDRDRNHFVSQAQLEAA